MKPYKLNWANLGKLVRTCSDNAVDLMVHLLSEAEYIENGYLYIDWIMIRDCKVLKNYSQFQKARNELIRGGWITVRRRNGEEDWNGTCKITEKLLTKVTDAQKPIQSFVVDLKTDTPEFLEKLEKSILNLKIGEPRIVRNEKKTIYLKRGEWLGKLPRGIDDGQIYVMKQNAHGISGVSVAAGYDEIGGIVTDDGKQLDTLEYSLLMVGNGTQGGAFAAAHCTH